MYSEWRWWRKLRKEWKIITTKLLEDISTNAEIMDLLVTFANKPIDEQYVNNFLQKVQTIAWKNSDHIQSILHFLAGETILNDEHESLRKLKYRIDIDQFIKVTGRYAFGTDLKLLSLWALLHKNNCSWDGTSNEMNIGALHIRTTDSFRENMWTMLDILQRKKRRRVAPRIYEITVWGKQYILKERKTKMYSNTHKNWDKPNSAFEDLNVGEILTNNAHSDFEEIIVSRERPCFALKTDDWFECSVYEKYEFLNILDVEKTLYKSIVSKRDIYEQEYQEIKMQCDKVWIDDVNLQRDYLNNKLNLIGKIKYAIRRTLNKKTISFHDFALAKANLLIGTSSSLLMKNRICNNIYTTDGDDYWYIVHNHPNTKTKLEIVWYDYEHYKVSNNTDFEKDHYNNVRNERKKEFYTLWAMRWREYDRALFEIATYFLQQKEGDKLLIS